MSYRFGDHLLPGPSMQIDSLEDSLVCDCTGTAARRVATSVADLGCLSCVELLGPLGSGEAMFSQDSLDPSSLAPWSTDLKVHICRASRGAINQPKRSQRDKPHANRFNLTDFIVLKAWPLCREPLREGRPIKSTISPIITPFTPSSSPCRQLLMRVVSMDTLGPGNAYDDVNIGCVECPETKNTKICMLEAFRAHWNCGLSEWWNYLEERFDINRSCRCTTQEIDLKILETTNSLLDRLTLRMVSSSSSSACSSSGGHLLLQAV